MRRFITIFVVVMFLSLQATATSAVPKIKGGKATSIDRWEVVDLVFESHKEQETPFEVDMMATFTSEDGTAQSVPAFYIGAKSWAVRFSADKAGKFSYTTHSSIKGLGNKKGDITVSSTPFKGSRGGVVVSDENPQKFARQSGDDYFMLGFECDFLFTLNYHNQEQTPELDALLDRVAYDRFNYMVMNVYGYDIKWEQAEELKEHPQYMFGGKDEIFPYGGTNQEPDYSTLNLEFFDKLDRVMLKLQERDIVSHLMIYVWSKRVAWAEAGSEDDNRYFDYVVKRYSPFPNLVWDISKEALGYNRVTADFISERIKRLRELDSFDRLATVHDYRYCAAHPEKVDFIIKQDWGHQFYAQMLNLNKIYTDKPSLNIEMGGYEEAEWEVYTNSNYIDAETCLRRNYESIFAGAYSTHYWQGASWNIIIYDWFKESYKGYKPKMEYYRYMAEFFERYPYSDFNPNPKFNSSGYCLSDHKGTYLFYLPKSSHKAEMWRLKALSQGVVSYQWFNTTTGEYTDKVTFNSWDEFKMPAHPFFKQSDAIFILHTTPKPKSKPRLVITTDINIDKGDPDDRQSMAHLFLYADELDIEAIIIDRPNAQGVEATKLVIEAYGKDYNNENYNFRQKHYPHPDSLSAKIYTVDEALEAGIIARIADQSTEPLYVAVWGNVRGVRDALEQSPKLVDKLRILTIGTEIKSPYDTEKCGERNWNDTNGDREALFADKRFQYLWWVENNWGYNGMFVDAEGAPLEYMKRLQAYGALGQHITDCTATKAWAQYFRVGDTPTIMYFINNANLDDPTKYNLGGYFVQPQPDERPNYYIDGAEGSKWNYASPCSSWSEAKAEVDARSEEMKKRREVMYELFERKLKGLYQKLELVGAQ